MVLSWNKGDFENGNMHIAKGRITAQQQDYSNRLHPVSHTTTGSLLEMRAEMGMIRK